MKAKGIPKDYLNESLRILELDNIIDRTSPDDLVLGDLGSISTSRRTEILGNVLNFAKENNLTSPIVVGLDFTLLEKKESN